MTVRKLLARIAAHPNTARFEEVSRLLRAFGFRLSRIRGSHHIYVHPSVPELVNVQNVRGEAKAYQVRQFLRIVERYDLPLKE